MTKGALAARTQLAIERLTAAAIQLSVEAGQEPPDFGGLPKGDTVQSQMFLLERLADWAETLIFVVDQLVDVIGENQETVEDYVPAKKRPSKKA